MSLPGSQQQPSMLLVPHPSVDSFRDYWETMRRGILDLLAVLDKEYRSSGAPPRSVLYVPTLPIQAAEPVQSTTKQKPAQTVVPPSSAAQPMLQPMVYALPGVQIPTIQ